MKFTEGDLVEYQKALYFVIAEKSTNMYVICSAAKVDLFGSEKERLQSIAKYSMTVYGDNLKLNDSGRLE